MGTGDASEPAAAVDMVAAERSIRRASGVALAALCLAVPTGWWLLPSIMHFPTDLSERLRFAVLWSLPLWLWVVAGVLMVSTGRRRSPADIAGAAAAPPSPALAVRVAFLQNTLEQAVIAFGLYLVLAALLAGPGLSLVVVGVAFFVVGRALFLHGYARAVTGRALGMTLTMLPTVLGYLLAVVLVVWRSL